MLPDQPAAQRAQGHGRGLASLLCSHVSPVSMCPPGCFVTGMHNVTKFTSPFFTSGHLLLYVTIKAELG